MTDRSQGRNPTRQLRHCWEYTGSDKWNRPHSALLRITTKMVNILSTLYVEWKLLLFVNFLWFCSLSVCLFERAWATKVSEIVIKGIADNYFDYFRFWLPSNHCLDRLRSLKRQTDWWVLNVSLLEICTFVQFSVTRACLSPGIDCNLDILLDFIVWLHPFLQRVSSLSPRKGILNTLKYLQNCPFNQSKYVIS